MWRAAKLDGDLGDARGKALSGPQIKGDASPAPVIDQQTCGDKCFRRRIFCHAGLLAVPIKQGRISRLTSRPVLPSDDIPFDAFRREWPDRLQNLNFFV